MDEVKLRLGSIEVALGTMRALQPLELCHEFCYLQLRMVCELIALACLIAHEDIRGGKQGKALIKEWSAPTIMKTLERLHPRFFPTPVTLNITPGNVHMEPKLVTTGYLTRTQFLTLYGKAGDALHRGSAKKLMAGKPYVAGNPQEIIEWANSIVKLLDQHHIPATDNLSHWICGLKGPNGKAFVAFAESPTPQQFGPPLSKDP
jgi:hypothetical protein